MKKQTKKFKTQIILGGDEVAFIDRDHKSIILTAASNKITAKQALRLAEWLKCAAKQVGEK